MKTDITIDKAREILSDPGYDAYGKLRIYFEYSEDSIYAGQIGSVKSTYQLDDAVKAGIDRIYTVGNDGTGMPPIRRA